MEQRQWQVVLGALTQQDAGTMMDEDFSKYAFVSMKMKHEDNSCQDEISDSYI